MSVPHVFIQAPLPVFLSEDGGVLVVGSNKSEVGGVDDAGAVVVVRRDDAGVWVLSEAVHAPSPTVDGNFGDTMALSRDGRLLVVAAMGEEDRGALYLYLDTGTGFVFSQRVVAPDRTGEGPVEFLAQDAFGQSIAISDDGAVLAVGAPRKDEGRNVSAGAVYVYRGLGLVR